MQYPLQEKIGDPDLLVGRESLTLSKTFACRLPS